MSQNGQKPISLTTSLTKKPTQNKKNFFTADSKKCPVLRVEHLSCAIGGKVMPSLRHVKTS